MKFNIIWCVILLFFNPFSYGQDNSEIVNKGYSNKSLQSGNNNQVNQQTNSKTIINNKDYNNIDSQSISQGTVSQAVSNSGSTNQDTLNEQNQNNQVQTQAQSPTQNEIEMQKQNKVSIVKPSGNDYSVLPDKIKNKLKGYEKFKSQYTNSQINDSNLECIQTLLLNIFYPLDYNSLDDYYKIICDPDTHIEPLLLLKQKIDSENNNGKKICKKNGNNYEIAYKLMKIQYYHNCIKDQDNNYCYNKYKSYYGNSLNFTNTTILAQNFWSNVKLEFYNVDKSNNEIDFCTKMIIFSNNLSNNLIKDEFKLELYYDFKSTYSFNVNKIKEYVLSDSKVNDITKYLINNKESFRDENVKKLIELSNESQNLNLSIYNSFIILVITIYLLL